MWFFYALISNFLLSLVLFTDEYLAVSNKPPEKSNIHTKVGSVLLISTLMSFVGAVVLGLATRDVYLDTKPLILGVLSAIPLVFTFASYFYLLQNFPVHQVGPIFQLTSVWLLVFELLLGGSVTIQGFIAIVILLYGAYVLDAGTFKWKVPTKLLIYGVPATVANGIFMYMARYASEFGSVTAFSFYQLVATGVIGVLLIFLLVCIVRVFYIG